MESKNLNLNKPTPKRNETNQPEPTSQPTHTNRHRGVLFLSISLLHIFVPISVPIVAV